MAVWQGWVHVTEVSSKCRGWTTSLTGDTQLEPLCMLHSTQFEWNSSLCSHGSWSSWINSCMSACVVTYTWIARSGSSHDDVASHLFTWMYIPDVYIIFYSFLNAISFIVNSTTTHTLVKNLLVMVNQNCKVPAWHIYSETLLNGHPWFVATLSIADTHLGPDCIAIQNST